MPRKSKYRVATPQWDQHPEYLSSCNKVIPPGGRSSYVVTEKERVSPTDITSFIFGQAEWSEYNLPEIAYILLPSEEWKVFTEGPLPQQKQDSQGRPMFEAYNEPGKSPRPLLDFAHLPDKISTAVHWFRLELWRRYDGRIGWEDIMMRMERPRPNQTALQMRASRGRTTFSMASWHGGSTRSNSICDTRRRIFEGLTGLQVLNNTTRGTTPGLIDPSLGELGGRVPIPQSRGSVARIRPPRRRNAARPRNLATSPTPQESENRNERLGFGRNGSTPLLDENCRNFDKEELPARYESLETYRPNTEAASTVCSDDELSEVSETLSASICFTSTSMDDTSYISAPRPDFVNFIESTFNNLNDNMDQYTIFETTKVPGTPLQKSHTKNKTDGNTSPGDFQNRFSLQSSKNLGSIYAFSSNASRESDAILGVEGSMNDTPDLFIGDPQLDAVIDSFCDTSFDRSSSMEGNSCQLNHDIQELRHSEHVLSHSLFSTAEAIWTNDRPLKEKEPKESSAQQRQSFEVFEDRRLMNEQTLIGSTYPTLGGYISDVFDGQEMEMEETRDLLAGSIGDNFDSINDIASEDEEQQQLLLLHLNTTMTDKATMTDEATMIDEATMTDEATMIDEATMTDEAIMTDIATMTDVATMANVATMTDTPVSETDSPTTPIDMPVTAIGNSTNVLPWESNTNVIIPSMSTFVAIQEPIIGEPISDQATTYSQEDISSDFEMNFDMNNFFDIDRYQDQT